MAIRSPLLPHQSYSIPTAAAPKPLLALFGVCMHAGWCQSSRRGATEDRAMASGDTAAPGGRGFHHLVLATNGVAKQGSRPIHVGHDAPGSAAM
jgi:hypothetical protein